MTTSVAVSWPLISRATARWYAAPLPFFDPRRPFNLLTGARANGLQDFAELKACLRDFYEERVAAATGSAHRPVHRDNASSVSPPRVLAKAAAAKPQVPRYAGIPEHGYVQPKPLRPASEASTATDAAESQPADDRVAYLSDIVALEVCPVLIWSVCTEIIAML
eukprot:SAG31_NODE_1646_length_7649_cov_3.317616_1_plen_164_part_00